MYKYSSFVVFFVLLTICFSNLYAQPREFSYQGELRTADGTIAPDGEYTLTVNIYEQSAGGASLYTESHLATVTKGVFSIIIGSVVPLPQNFPFDKTLFLGLKVGDDIEMIPRTAIVSAPRAIYAGTAGEALRLAEGADGVVTSINELSGALRIIGDSTISVSYAQNAIKLHAFGGGSTVSGIESITSPQASLDINAPQGPIVSMDVADGGITTAKLRNGAVTGNKIAQLGALNGQALKWNGTIWAPANDLGMSSVAVTSPITGDGSTGNPLALPVASSSTSGYLSSNDWTIFNSKLSSVSVTPRLSGNGTPANPLDIAQQGASNGQVLKWNGTNWSPANDVAGLTGVSVRSPELSGTGISTDPITLAQQGAVTGQVLKWNGTSWSPTGDNGLTTVAVNSPLTGNGTTGNPISVPQANGSTNGYLSSADWTVFNNKLSAVAVTPRLTGNGTTANPLDIAQQGATTGQVLRWNGTTWLPGAGGIISVVANAPISGDGTAGNPLSIAQANGSTNGYLSSTDWTTFNNKLSTVAVTARLTGNGTVANPLDIAQQGATTGQVLRWNGTTWSPGAGGLTSVFANAPITGDGTSGNPLTMAQANGSTNGFLSSTDWTTFNNKLSTVAVTPRLTGNGTVANPLDIAQQGATNGQVLKWNGSIWSPANDVGGLSSVATDATLAGDGTAGNVLKIAQQGATNGQVLKWNGSTWLPANDNGLSTVSVRSPELAGSGTTADPIYLSQQGATSGQVLKWNGTSWSPAADVGLATVAVNSPLSGNGTTGSPISIAQANGSTNGYLSSTDWTTFNNKLSAVAVTPRLIGNGTTANPLDIAQQGATNGQVLKWNGTTWTPANDAGGSVLTDATLAGDGTAGNVLKIAQQGATNGKVLKWNGSTWLPADDLTGLTTVAANAPITGNGTSGNPLSIAQANSTTNGYLSSTDWTTFNNKLSTVAVTPRLTGNGTVANPLDIAQQGATTGQVLRWNGTTWSPGAGGLTSVFANAPIIGDGTSGNPLSIAQANGSTNGYLSSTDWTTFNNKLSAVAVTARLTGNGTTANPLDIAQQGATSGQVLKWNGSSWAPSSDLTGTLANGTVTNSTLRWNGTNWVENTNVLSTAPGEVTVNAGLNLNGTTSPLLANGSAGTSGYVLRSMGAGATPQWADPNSLVTAWRLGGNTLTGASSSAPVEFFGSTNNYDIVFRSNNTERMRIVSTGNVGIGLTNPAESRLVSSSTFPGGSTHRHSGLFLGTYPSGMSDGGVPYNALESRMYVQNNSTVNLIDGSMVAITSLQGTNTNAARAFIGVIDISSTTTATHSNVEGALGRIYVSPGGSGSTTLTAARALRSDFWLQSNAVTIQNAYGLYIDAPTFSGGVNANVLNNYTGLYFEDLNVGVGNRRVIHYDAAGSNLPFVLTYQGRVGIGLTAPSELLDVRGNIRLTANSGAAQQLQFQNPAGTQMTTITAGAQTSAINYTLPTAAAAQNGALMTSTTGGAMSWSQNLAWDGTNSRLAVNAATANTKLDVNGDIALRENTISLTAGNNNNVNVGNYSFIRITATGNFTITGISGGQDGRMLILFNNSGSSMTINHNDANSNAGNRILTRNAANYTTPGASNFDVVQMMYSAANSAWIIISTY